MEQLKSMAQIDEIILEEMVSPKENDYISELARLLVLYRDLLKEMQIWKGEGVYENQFIYDMVYKNVREIIKLVKYYHVGDLIGSEKIVNRFFKLTGCKIPVFSRFPKTKLPALSIFYRSRNERVMDRKDIFHVPFQERGKIGTQRFSFPGYPCLYLSSSVACNIKEVGKGKNNIYSSAFMNISSFDVYDFRFYKEQDPSEIPQKILINEIVSYPFKIAVSIPVSKEKEDNKYKEEYIIPQIVLHGVIRQRIGGNRPIGILFSSTKAIQDGISKADFAKYQDLVIPAMTITDSNRYCRQLCQMFQLTKPQELSYGLDNCLAKGEFRTIDPRTGNDID